MKPGGFVAVHTVFSGLGSLFSAGHYNEVTTHLNMSVIR